MTFDWNSSSEFENRPQMSNVTPLIKKKKKMNFPGGGGGRNLLLGGGVTFDI